MIAFDWRKSYLGADEFEQDLETKYDGPGWYQSEHSWLYVEEANNPSLVIRVYFFDSPADPRQAFFDISRAPNRKAKPCPEALNTLV